MTWLPAAASFAAALILQDCVLLAAGGLLSVRGFYWSMDRAAPLTPMAAALRCLAAGLTLPVLGSILVFVAIAALLGWWTPYPQLSELTLIIVIVTVAAPALIRYIQGFGSSGEVGVDALAAVALIMVVALRNSGFGAAACWALLICGVIIFGVAWHLARTTANSFLALAKP